MPTRRPDRRSGWREVPCENPSPAGRIGHTLVVGQDGMVYLWGGVNENLERGSKYLDDFYTYKVEEGEWKKIELTGQTPEDLPCGRAFHSAVMHNTEMLIFGGCNGRGRFNETFGIDVTNGQCRLLQPLARTAAADSQAQTPSTRYCHSAVMYEGKMVVFGGKCGGRNSNKRLADMYSFDVEASTWRIWVASGEIPSSRSAHTAIVYRDRMLMFGGRDADGNCCEDLYEFNFSNSLWSRVSCHPLFMRARHSVVLHNDKLITFAGWNGKKKLNDLFRYHLDSHEFEMVHESDENDPRLPCRRECHTAVVVRNRMVMFGGRFRGLFMHDTYEYPLGVMSLKEFVREWICMQPQFLGHWDQDKPGLPEPLMQYVDNYR